MSEKRFELAEDSNGLFSIFDNEDEENRPLIYGAEFGTDFIVDLLNSLNDENEQLRQRIAFFEKQADEFEQYTAQTIQNMIANYRDDE